MSKKFGWVDFANLGAQIAQARAQSATHQELMQQTRLMQSESQRKHTEIQAKQYLVQCENSLNKSTTVFGKYPYYAILRLEYIAEEFRRSNLQSLFTEIQDLRIANEFQNNIDNKIRELRNEDTVLEERLSGLKDSMNEIDRFGDAYSCIIQNDGLKDAEPEYNRISNKLNEKNEKRKRIYIIAVSLLLLLSYATGWFPNVIRGTNEWNGCDYDQTREYYDCDDYGDWGYREAPAGFFWEPEAPLYLEERDFWYFTIIEINLNDGSKIINYHYGKSVTIQEWGGSEWSDIWVDRCSYDAFTNNKYSSSSFFNPTPSNVNFELEWTEPICHEEAPLVLIIPEFTVLFIFGLFYLIYRKSWRIKIPTEIKEKMEIINRNRIIIGEIISSIEYVSNEEEIVNHYNYHSEIVSKNFPTENSYLI